ncbi:MAG: DUF374 domain-containing protein [Proteobacteria bacterium]|nr:DUF374 domain-containing protein [Pseudomonadota bacterium]
MPEFYKRWLEDRYPVWLAQGYAWLARSWRARVLGLEGLTRHPVNVLAMWHHDELATLPILVRQDLTVLISQSRDGDLIAKGATSLGYRAERGSSSRGAVKGLVAMMKAAREGFSTIFTVDGLNGPARVVKPGVIRVAQKSGLPILPFGVVAERKFIFDQAWNKVYVPYPLSRVVLAFGEPTFLPPRGDQDELCLRVATEIDACRDRARAALADWANVPRITPGVMRRLVGRV